MQWIFTESILSGLLALGAAILFELIYSYLRRKRVTKRELSSGERIQQSISKLGDVSKEIDVIIQNIIQEIKHRQTVLEELKSRHQTLSHEEKELSKRVEMLREIPIEVANYFQQINEQALQQVEKKRSKRDIIMFIFGIIVTTVIAMLLRAFGLA